MSGRRDFLGEAWRWTGLALSAFGLALLARILRSARTDARGIDVAEDAVRRLAAGAGFGVEGIFLTGTPVEPRALSLECTHLGCRVAPIPGGGFVCGCHGSRYDREGQVISGPAKRPLRTVRLERTSSGWIARL